MVVQHYHTHKRFFILQSTTVPKIHASTILLSKPYRTNNHQHQTHHPQHLTLHSNQLFHKNGQHPPTQILQISTNSYKPHNTLIFKKLLQPHTVTNEINEKFETKKSYEYGVTNLTILNTNRLNIVMSTLIISKF